MKSIIKYGLCVAALCAPIVHCSAVVIQADPALLGVKAFLKKVHDDPKHIDVKAFEQFKKDILAAKEPSDADKDEIAVTYLQEIFTKKNTLHEKGKELFKFIALNKEKIKVMNSAQLEYLEKQMCPALFPNWAAIKQEGQAKPTTTPAPTPAPTTTPVQPVKKPVAPTTVPAPLPAPAPIVPAPIVR